jgi:hypothetical protein
VPSEPFERLDLRPDLDSRLDLELEPEPEPDGFLRLRADFDADLAVLAEEGEVLDTFADFEALVLEVGASLRFEPFEP